MLTLSLCIVVSLWDFCHVDCCIFSGPNVLRDEASSRWI